MQVLTRIFAHRFPARALAVTAAALVLVCAAGSGPGRQTAAADELLTPARIVANMISQNPGMRTYQSNVRVDCRLLSFPYLGARLVGRTYFKRPDNFEVVFDRVPAYARGFERLYSDIGDPVSWPATYNMSVAGYSVFNGRRDIVLRLVKKNKGMIDHEDVAIDPIAWHIDNMEWFYDNGGYVGMSQEFRREGAFVVLKEQHATIRLLHVHAMAEAKYAQYTTNVELSDAIFTKSESR